MKNKILKTLLSTTIAVGLCSVNSFAATLDETAVNDVDNTSVANEVPVVDAAEPAANEVASATNTVGTATIAELFAPELAASVAATLELTITDVVTQAQLESITMVFVLEATSLEGIELLPHLMGVSLMKGTATDLSLLTQLPELTFLTLYAIDEADIDMETVMSLSNLTFLTVASANLVDINFVTALPHLVYLNLSENNIADITPLSSMTNLTTLVLIDNYIADVSPLSNLSNLATILIDDNMITDLRPMPKNACISATYQVHVSLVGHPGAPVSVVKQANIVYNRDGSLMTPRAINNEGTYEEPTFYFNVPDATYHTQYTYNTDNTAELPLLSPEELKELAAIAFGDAAAMARPATANEDCVFFSGTVLYLIEPNSDVANGQEPTVPPVSTPNPTPPPTSGTTPPVTVPTTPEAVEDIVTKVTSTPATLPNTGEAVAIQTVIGLSVSAAGAVAFLTRRKM